MDIESKIIQENKDVINNGSKNFFVVDFVKEQDI